MWVQFGWGLCSLVVVVEIILTVGAWQLGFIAATGEATQRERDMTTAAATALLEAHEQNVRLSMQMAEVTTMIAEVKRKK